MNEPGSTSDGYHTFKELYEHRFELWITVCRQVQSDPRHQYREAWRTRVHSDGSVMDGWFVLGISEFDPQTCKQITQMTYHLPDERWHDCGSSLVGR